MCTNMKPPFRLSLFLVAAFCHAPAFAQEPTDFLSEYALKQRAWQVEAPRRAQWLTSLRKTSGPDTSGFDALYYDLNLNISTSPQNLTGTVFGRFRSTKNGLATVKLDFDKSPNWQNFSVTGNAASWTHAGSVLGVQLDRVYNIGETFELTVQYSGVPSQGGLKGFAFDTNQYGDLVVSTLSEPFLARTWWPCKDDPSDKADSVRVSVTVPNNLLVGSNGLLVATNDNGNGTKTFVWKESYPITTYLVSLAISNYATFSDRFEYAPGQFLPIEYYVYPAQLNSAKTAFANVPTMLRVFSELFGEYPFLKEKYGHAVFPWGGAMEHQTLTSIGSVSTSAEYVYAHELAHQWYGDLVTCENWGDIWLNEGFATYSEALYYRALNGVQAYHNYMNARLGSMTSWGSEAVYRYNTQDVWAIFNRTVYDKGAWVLHALRHVIGDSVFLKILRNYPNDPAFKFKSATTAQFRDYCEQIAGTDLNWFFQQWIYEPYFPVYQWGYVVTPAQNGYALYLEIRQTQSQVSPQYHHLYKMPIDIRVTYADRTTQTFVVWDSLAVQRFQITLPQSPVAVSFDPDRWILREARQIPVSAVLVNDETPRAFALMQNYPNPVALNKTTTANLVYTIPQTTEVELRVYDSLGRQVHTLILGKQMPGTYLVPFETKNLAAGIYLYRLRAGQNVATRKMAVIR